MTYVFPTVEEVQAIEAQAREIRAQEMAKLVSGFVNWVSEKLHIARPIADAV